MRVLNFLNFPKYIELLLLEKAVFVLIFNLPKQPHRLHKPRIGLGLIIFDILNIPIDLRHQLL